MKSLKIGLILFFLISCLAKANQNDIIWAKYGVEQHADNFQFSPDGNYLSAFYSGGNTFRVYSTQNTSAPFIFNDGQMKVIYSSVFSTDSKKVAVCYSEGTQLLRIWEKSLDLNTSGKIWGIELYNVTSAQISPNFKYLCGIDSSSHLFVYDIMGQSFISDKFLDTTFKCFTTAFSSTGDTMFVCTGSEMFMFDMQTKNSISEISLVSSKETLISINKTGEYIQHYTPSTSELTVTNLKSRINVKQFMATGLGCFAGEEHLVFNNNLELFDFDLYKKDTVASLLMSSGSGFAVKEDAGKLTVAYSAFNGLNLYDFSNGKTLTELAVNNYHSYFCNDGNNIFSSALGIVFNTVSGKELQRNSNILDVLPDTSIYYQFREPNNIDLYDINSKKLLRTITSDSLTQNCFLPNLNFFYYVDDNSVCKIFNTSTMEKVYSYENYMPVMFSKHSKYIAYCSYGSSIDSLDVNVIELLTGKQKLKIPVAIAKTGYNDYVFSNDENYFFTRKFDENIKKYDLTTGVVSDEYSGTRRINSSSVSFINISSDDKFLIFENTSNFISVLNLNTKMLDYLYDDYFSQINTLEISPDMNYVHASFEDGTSILWKARFGEAGVNETVTSAGISVYPNPVSSGNKIFLTIPNVIGIADKVVLFNNLGETLETFASTQSNESNTYELTLNQELPSGVYFLKVFSKGSVSSVPVVVINK